MMSEREDTALGGSALSRREEMVPNAHMEVLALEGSTEIHPGGEANCTGTGAGGQCRRERRLMGNSLVILSIFLFKWNLDSSAEGEAEGRREGQQLKSLERGERKK